MSAKCQVNVYPDHKTTAQLAVSRSWFGKVRNCCSSRMKYSSRAVLKSLHSTCNKKKRKQINNENRGTEWQSTFRLEILHLIKINIVNKWEKEGKCTTPVPCIKSKLTGRENKSWLQCTDRIEKMLTHHNLSDRVQLRAELQIFDLALDLTQLLRSQYASGLKGHKTSCHHRSFAKRKSINKYEALKYQSNNQCRQKERRNSFKMHTKRKGSTRHFQVPK